jgi:hypothetical protein
MSDKAAVTLARKRWKDVSKKERAEFAASVAKARWDRTTPEQRQEIGRKLREARAKKKAETKGPK